MCLWYLKKGALQCGQSLYKVEFEFSSYDTVVCWTDKLLWHVVPKECKKSENTSYNRVDGYPQ